MGRELRLELLVHDVNLDGRPLDAIKRHGFGGRLGIHALHERVEIGRLKESSNFVPLVDRKTDRCRNRLTPEEVAVGAEPLFPLRCVENGGAKLDHSAAV